jgi:hypothetical protein
VVTQALTAFVRELVRPNRSLDEGGAIAIVKLLVDSNADVALFDDAGRTALHYAFDARSAYQVQTCAARPRGVAVTVLDAKLGSRLGETTRERREGDGRW